MRLSLLSDDGDVAELLISKALELMSQAETAAAEDQMASRACEQDRDTSEPT
jgi:hypothetical protein